MKRILVPIDFSGCADIAVNFAVQTTKILPVKVAILHAFLAKKNIHQNYMGVNEEIGIKIKMQDSNASSIIGNSKVPVMVIPYEYE